MSECIVHTGDYDVHNINDCVVHTGDYVVQTYQ